VRGKAHSNEVKAQVMASLLAGQGIAETAEQYQLPEHTIRNWARRNPELKELATKKRVELDDLITEYVREAFTTLSVQARHFRDRAWLQKQPAAEIAVLHGVITDKAIRILSAAQPTEPPSDDGGPGGPDEAVGAQVGTSDPGPRD
jgi:hypothetical protein